MAFCVVYDKEAAHKEIEYSPIPEGDYPVDVLNVEEKISQSGINMIKLELGISSGQYSNRKVFYYLLENDKFISRKVLEIMESCKRPEPEKIHPGIFYNLHGNVHLKITEYQGKKGNNVTKWNAPAKGVDPKNNLGPDEIPF